MYHDATAVGSHSQQIQDISSCILTGDCGLRQETDEQDLRSDPETPAQSEFKLDINQPLGSGYWQFNRLDDDLSTCLVRSCYTNSVEISCSFTQEYYILRYIMTGSVKVKVKGAQPYCAPSGKLCLQHVRPGETVTLDCPKDTVIAFLSIFISRNFMNRLCQLLPIDSQENLRLMLSQRFGPEDHETDINLFERSLIFQIQSLSSAGELKRFTIKSMVRELLSRWLMSYAVSPEPTFKISDCTPHTDKFQKVFDLLQTNYIAPPPTREISRLVGLNQSALRRGFRATYGKSISAHCLEKRMNRACELLLSRKMNISQISDDLGYAHSTNFTSAFKKYFGVLPKDYRTKDLILSRK